MRVVSGTPPPPCELFDFVLWLQILGDVFKLFRVGNGIVFPVNINCT